VIRNQVKELRKQHAYSQKQLAELAHVSRQTIISIEGDHYQPSLELCFRLSKIFNKKIDEVFLYTEN